MTGFAAARPGLSLDATFPSCASLAWQMSSHGARRRGWPLRVCITWTPPTLPQGCGTRARAHQDLSVHDASRATPPLQEAAAALKREACSCMLVDGTGR